MSKDLIGRRSLLMGFTKNGLILSSIPGTVHKTVSKDVSEDN